MINKTKNSKNSNILIFFSFIICLYLVEVVMANLFVDMDINNLAEFLFTKNDHNKQIDLSINGIENTRDFFCFCLDIMCKGLVLLFGKDNKVALNDLSLHDFEIVNTKMKCAGIKCLLKVYPIEEQPETLLDLWTQNVLNVQNVRMCDENMKFEDYHFDIQTMESIYKISFQLTHNVPETILHHNVLTN